MKQTTDLSALKARLAKPVRYAGPTPAEYHAAQPAPHPADSAFWLPLTPPPGFDINRLPHNLQATVRTSGAWGPRALEAAWNINRADEAEKAKLQSTVRALVDELQNTAAPDPDANVSPLATPKGKTHTIRLRKIKDESWGELAAALGLSRRTEEKHFEYGEYATIEIELDESLRIVGGRVVPLAELGRQ